MKREMHRVAKWLAGAGTVIAFTAALGALPGRPEKAVSPPARAESVIQDQLVPSSVTPPRKFDEESHEREVGQEPEEAWEHSSKSFFDENDNRRAVGGDTTDGFLRTFVRTRAS